MKLIYCPDCDTIKNIGFEITSCKCGKVKVRMDNNYRIQWNQEGVILGINNSSFRSALLKHKKKSLMGYDFEAFVIPFDNASILPGIDFDESD